MSTLRKRAEELIREIQAKAGLELERPKIVAELTVEKYFHRMLQKYGLGNVSIPRPIVSIYDALSIGPLYGYVKKTASQTARGTEVDYEINISSSHAALWMQSVNWLPLLEILGGLMGSTIRMSQHDYDFPVPTFSELSSGHLEDTKYYWTDQQRQQVRVLKFFEWVGRHVFRDAYDSEWEFPHEVYTMKDSTEPLTKQTLAHSKRKMLRELDKQLQKIEKLSREVRMTKEDFEVYSGTVKVGMNNILDVEMFRAIQTDPVKEFFYRQINGNFLFWDMNLFAHPAISETSLGISGVLGDDFDGYFEAYRKWPQMLIDDAKKWPQFLEDLANDPRKMTSEILFERLFKLKMKATQKGLKAIRQRLRDYRLTTWFDVTAFDSEETKQGFMSAEKHEPKILKTLPSVIKMPDEEVESKFFTK